jgi:hypothetical protein
MTSRVATRHLTVLLACACLAAGGCQTPSANGPADTFGLDFSMPDGMPAPGAIVFVVDGVNARVFQEMMEANELPALREYFVDRGLYVPRAAASAPGVTIANLTSIATGRFPGRHDVLANRWFDRNQLVYRDYETISQKNLLDSDCAGPMIWESFPDDLTYSCFFQPHRRATVWDENFVAGGVTYFLGMYTYIDRMTLNMLGNMAKEARAARRFPALTVCYLLAPDFAAYAAGTSPGDSAQYRDALRHTDRQIGRVLGDLRRAGLLDRVRLAFVSDHGHLPTPRHIDPRRYLAERAGLDVATGGPWESTPFARRQAAFEKHAAVAAVGGDRYFALYLRRPLNAGREPAGLAPWLDRPSPADLRAYPSRGGKTIDLPRLLAQAQAVDAVACASGPGSVRVIRAGGEVEFRQEGGAGGDITCSIVSGDDPLGWSARLPADLAAGRPASPRRWLEATLETQFPDLPAQILACFQSRHSPDIAVFAAPGWDFGRSNKSGHGGLRAEEMFVPMLLAGPGVPHGRQAVARSVDLAPTLLRLLGKPVPPGLDGEPLAGDSEPASAAK